MPDGPRLLIPTLSAVNFIVGMGAFLVVGLVEPIADDFRVSDAQSGALLTTYAILYAIMSPLLVSLTGRIGRRRVLAMGLVIFGTAALLSALAPTLFALHLTRGLAAMGAGVITPITAAVAAMLVPPERRARTLAAVFAGLTIAQAVGIPVGGWVAYTFGWRYAFAIVAILSAPALIVMWRIVPAGLSFSPVSLRDLGATLRDLPVMAAILFTATFLCAIFALYTYFAPLLAADMGFARDGITLALLIFGLGAIVGNIAGGRLSDRFGPSRTLVVLTALQVLTLPLYSFLPLPTAAVMVYTFVWSVIGWSFGTAQQARLVLLDPARAPVLMALNAAAIYIGAAAGSAIGGLVIDRASVSALGLAAALVMAVALAHLIASDRATARNTRP
ncbi:MFS transporter [Hasllibacter sp. MH4015]|uniref:MFS transporter n=1 Tax=Hasllibacter sp. MH4015 TaxID=2854029 RepID=UPI001CD4502B|nr:MFS transporter [Hasllibacter sp. MH4015]